MFFAGFGTLPPVGGVYACPAAYPCIQPYNAMITPIPAYNPLVTPVPGYNPLVTPIPAYNPLFGPVMPFNKAVGAYPGICTSFSGCTSAAPLAVDP